MASRHRQRYTTHSRANYAPATFTLGRVVFLISAHLRRCAAAIRRRAAGVTIRPAVQPLSLACIAAISTWDSLPLCV